MDSPSSAARGRGRASARKRHTFPSGGPSSSQPGPGAVTAVEPVDQFSSSAPADSVASSSFSFETPSPTAPRGTRARARVTEGNIPSSDDLDGKGGRSLRKRARVDYTIDHVDEYMSDGGKATPSSVRALKRRRTDTAFQQEIDDGEEPANAHIKRRSSEQLPPPPSTLRKRNQSRKPGAELQGPMPDRHAEDVEVHDTIEVGGHHSEQSDESTLRRTSSITSSGFSNDDSKPPHLTAPPSSFPSPRRSHLSVARTDSNPKHHQNGAEQPKAARTSLPSFPKKPAGESPRISYEHLTPYIENAFVEWPAVPLEADATVGLQPLQQDAAEETADDQPDGTQADSFKVDAAQEDTPLGDSLVPDSTPVDGAMEETPAMSPLPMDTRANSPIEDIGPPYIQPPLRGPISFKKTRDASEFTRLFENHKSLSSEEVWARLEVVQRALASWQDEYIELRKITDDEDNAVRYRQEEAGFAHRQKMAISKDPETILIQKDFVIKGVRAERPDPEIAYARYQDKLMATNYFFEYDDKEAKIGFQDPAEQKTGPGKGRLRDRPKQTAKAAEADDSNVVQGKRVRKPPVVYDGSEVASRGSSPVVAQRRRRRPGNATEDVGEANPAAPTAANTPVEQAPPKKKGKGGRPRKHPLPAPIPEHTPAPVEEVQPQPEQIEPEKPARKRRRRRAVVEEGPEVEGEAVPATNGVDPHAPPTKPGPRRTHSRLSEVPTNSFYSSSMQSTNMADESRPATSSSTATQSTVTSNNYQLREKRQKKFSLNPDGEVYDEEPKPKRVKRSKKAQAEDSAATALPAPIPSPVPPQQSTLEPHPAPKPPTKIKLKNYNGHISAPPPISVPAPNPFSVPSSSNSTPPHSSNSASNSATNGADPADIKDYNQMTKSEKMSHSMKARWASGSMSQAVAKRRATLANKKQAVKAAEPSQPLEAIPVMKQP
ncbi:hypothetical protein SAMD00023353_1002210 [Rosellinia necatrix]|uniref:Uncharacterized protein n=1 Tax=Rosellinia necatrix TaxID=77044 RepID=A0A1W2TBL8_ROSNE|nr:hypothetical protein SAMD00023353_1002210 [Rosellinia necatrix]